MTTRQQPEALRLARWLEHRSMSGVKPNDLAASTELRRLHAYVVELESQLEAIGAGGVESLRGAKPMSDLDMESLVLKHAPPIHPDFLDKDDHEELIRAVEHFHNIGAE